MIQTYGLTHIQLSVKDVERSMRFYESLFGMKVHARPTETFVMMQTPGSQEIYTLNSDPEGKEQSGKMGGIAHFGFRMRERGDMAEVLAQVKQAGGQPIDHGKSASGKRDWAFFSDPDGYEIEVFWEL